MVLNIGGETDGGNNNNNNKKSKCYFAHTLLPQFIDEAQPPTKRRPFCTLLGRGVNHSLDLVVPASAAVRVREEVAEAAGRLRYARVQMTLLEVLGGEFFNHYVKTGNILLLSQGRKDIDNTIALADGILRLEMDKATYERAGLQGSPIPSPGRRHVKARFRVELNLRLPSMVKGKKGFERLLWAAKEVFDQRLDWLFYDLRSPETQDAGPVKEFGPFLRTVDVEATNLDGVSVPRFPEKFADDEDSRVQAEELLEWLSLVCLDSPRVRDGDAIDTFLSRYRVPVLDGQEAQKADLVRLRWYGFMPATWVTKVFTAAVKASGEDWFAVQVGGFEGRGVVVLKVDGKALTWECE